jgi:hypothetical protein
MAGGSHTNFNSKAFSVGAVSGAGLLASALGAGINNYRAVMKARYANWNAEALRSGLELSELLRAKEHKMLHAKDREIADLRLANARLKADLARTKMQRLGR